MFTKQAVNEVDRLRKSRKLPFPTLSRQRIDELEGTLDYPPRGSVEATTYAQKRQRSRCLTSWNQTKSNGRNKIRNPHKR
jgi:hypothetical protein